MRIVVTHRSSIDRVGGVVTFMMELSEALIKMGHEVIILNFSNKCKPSELAELYNVFKLPPIISLKKWEDRDYWPPRGSSLSDLMTWFTRGSKIISTLQPDIVIINGIVPLLKRRATTYIAVAHMVYPHVFGQGLNRLLLKILYSQIPDRIVAITAREKYALVKGVGIKEEKIEVIPLCLNVDKFNYVRALNRKPILLHVGGHRGKCARSSINRGDT